MSGLSAWWHRLAATDPRTRDVALVSVLGAAAVVDWMLGQRPLLALVTRLLVAGSVLLRRRNPTLGFAVAIVAKQPFDIGPEGYVALLIDAYALGVYSTARWRSLILLVIGNFTFFGEWTAFLLIVMAWLIGDIVRDRRAAEAALERERAASNRGALEERARIARDLHDVVAHAVSVIVVQAEGAKNMLRRDPERASAAIDAIASSGREALGELRQLLQVLGPDDDHAPMAPAPTADDIDDLVARVRAAGQHVELRVGGEPRPLEPALSQTAYRVVQEALTNAVRYAAGAQTEVTLDYGTDRLVLEVVDHGGSSPGAKPVGSGTGLRGLRERLAIFGGELSTGRTEDGGFVVRASLPC
jgi:signal transduction histidine kinase